MTLLAFIRDCTNALPRLGPTVVKRLIEFARRAWSVVLTLLRRHGGFWPALPYIRRAAGI